VNIFKRQRCLISRVANCCPPFVWWSLCKYSCQGQRLCHVWYINCNWVVTRWQSALSQNTVLFGVTCQFQLLAVKSRDKVASDKNKRLYSHYLICQLSVVTSCQLVCCVSTGSSATSVCISWVGYINMIDEWMRSGIQILADRIKTLYRGWQTYGTQKDFLGKCHSLLSQLFLISSARPAPLYCKEYGYIYKYLTL